MKLAISGSAGIGKTTLASALAARLDCALIDEAYDDFFDDDHEFIRPAARLRAAIRQAVDRKRAAEDEHGVCVADRCPADLFSLWLSCGFSAHRAATAEMYRRCRQHIDTYRAIVVPPWGALPLRQLPDPVRRRRITNPWSQLHAHATIIGLLHQWVPRARLLPIPFDHRTPEARVRFVLAALGLAA